MVTVLEESVKGGIVSRLKELGLSTNEAVAYTALLAHPRLTASALCKETGVPDSKIYYALDGLSRKGMIIIQQSARAPKPKVKVLVPLYEPLHVSIS